MTFADKLNYLFKITGASNYDFTKETGVKQSMVSLYRNGKRNMPKKDETIQAIAFFFASRITDNYQTQAIASYTNNLVLMDGLSVKSRQNDLYTWLIDVLPDPDKSTKDMMNTFSHDLTFKSSGLDVVAVKQDSHIYFGANGKQEALLSCLKHSLTVAEPKNIYINVDESIDWFFMDPAFVETVNNTINTLIERGFKFYHIMPPFSCRNYYEIIYNFLPFYQTESMLPFYYPRFRDNVFRGFMIAMEDEICMLSFGIDAGHGSDFASVSTDKELVKRICQMMKDFLSLTRPAMNVTNGKDTPTKLFYHLAFTKLGLINYFISLPLTLIPVKNVETILPYVDSPEFKSQILNNMNNLIPDIDIRGYIIDICHVHSPRDVKAGKVKILFPGINPEILPSHTLTTYRRHLESMYSFIIKNDNYYLIIANDTDNPDSSLMIQKGKSALFLRAIDNTTLFEVTEPEIIKAGEEFLYRIAEQSDYNGIGRIKTIEKLSSLIKEFKIAEENEK